VRIERFERVRRYAGRPGFRLSLCRANGESDSVAGMALSVHARVDDNEVANVVLSCHPAASAAQALYRSCGFRTPWGRAPA
jgi:hypothetical protein